MSETADTRAMLRDQAAAVLHGNDAGSWTRAAPRLYPHQWNWDSAFIAIGWAHLDVRRATTELEQLFAAQWSTGMVPHIVFRAGPDKPYFPGPEWWDCAVSPAAPAPPLRTTGICQPPVHALALRRIWQLTPETLRPEIRARVQALYPRLVAWHRYLATQRDPEASGLVTIYHPWEGTDNSPRWDRALARIEVAKPGPYSRLDTSQVGDPSQRPTDWDYDRYLWLVGLLRQYRYDDARIYRHYPFLIKDVFFSAVLASANAALLELADVAGAGAGDRERLAGWLDRGRQGLARCFDVESGLCLDYDVRAGERIRLRTFAGFAPLFAATADAGQLAAQLRLLDSADFCGNPRLRWRLLPSTSPAEPAFEPRNYWRGPVWPVIDWLLWHSLTMLGCSGRAAELRGDSLGQIATAGEFAEYFEPFSGKPLGSTRQSWTAAVALDWLAAGQEALAAIEDVPGPVHQPNTCSAMSIAMITTASTRADTSARWRYPPRAALDLGQSREGCGAGAPAAGGGRHAPVGPPGSKRGGSCSAGAGDRGAGPGDVKLVTSQVITPDAAVRQRGDNRASVRRQRHGLGRGIARAQRPHSLPGPRVHSAQRPVVAGEHRDAAGRGQRQRTNLAHIPDRLGAVQGTAQHALVQAETVPRHAENRQHAVLGQGYGH